MDDLLNEPETSLANGLDVRCKNAFCFGNLTYQIHPGVTTGLEVSGWQTEYLNPSQENDQKPTDIRIQWSLQSKF